MGISGQGGGADQLSVDPFNMDERSIYKVFRVKNRKPPPMTIQIINEFISSIKKFLVCIENYHVHLYGLFHKISPSI